MNLADFQRWLNARGAQLVADGVAGPATRAAVPAVFANPRAPAVTDSDIAAIALRLGCTSKQVRAVAKVESGGSAFDQRGRPKILFERHKFHGFTAGRWSVAAWSNPAGGGYGEDSWDKLARAACANVEGAFASTSWGRFQVMGFHAHALGFDSALDLAWSTVGSEAAHYELLVRFIEANRMQPKLRALSRDPATCRAFAAAYNGKGYAQNRYDVKLAEAML